MPQTRAHERPAMAIMTAIHAMPFMERCGVVGASAAFMLSFMAERYMLRVYGRSIRTVRTEDDARVSWSLFRDFFQVGHLALPTWRCREAIGTAIFILLFAVKAVVRVWVSKSNGEVLATMMHGARSERVYRFIHRILIRFSAGLVAAMTSGAIEGIRPWLIGCYRERLSREMQRRFYRHLVYYQATVLDNRLEAVDTVIATYCGEFAEHFAELPYYFVLPGLEYVTSLAALVQQAGVRPAMLMSVIGTSAVLLLRSLAPAFGHIHSMLLSRENDYRRMLTNNMNDVENIAMHNAGSYTRRRLDGSLARLKYTLDHMALAKGNFEMLETAFTTFMTVMAEMVTFSSTQATFFHRSINDVYLEIQLIEDLNTSVKDFVVNFRELSHLSEFTTRMAAFDTTLKSIAAGTLIHEAPAVGNDPRPSSPIEYTLVQRVKHAPDATVFPMVKMDNVLLQSPVGQLLFENMTLEFRSDEDWVIIGENGCGKTSLLRMLCGLWMPKSGRLSQDESIVYLLAPQHSYMAPQCTLYEQISFPKAVKEATPEIRAAVKEAIELAGAQTVVNVIQGYDSPVMGLDFKNVDESYDWSSLSGGQKERISMARVFFHVLCMDRTKQTPVAILDEATSMMDDTEQDVLNNLRRLNVRMISVTHRDVVIRHHTNILRLTHDGGWSTETVHNQVKAGERVTTEDNTV